MRQIHDFIVAGVGAGRSRIWPGLRREALRCNFGQDLRYALLFSSIMHGTLICF